jgi:hypothetical protein
VWQCRWASSSTPHSQAEIQVPPSCYPTVSRIVGNIAWSESVAPRLAAQCYLDTGGNTHLSSHPRLPESESLRWGPAPCGGGDGRGGAGNRTHTRQVLLSFFKATQRFSCTPELGNPWKSFPALVWSWISDTSVFQLPKRGKIVQKGRDNVLRARHGVVLPLIFHYQEG